MPSPLDSCPSKKSPSAIGSGLEAADPTHTSAQYKPYKMPEISKITGDILNDTNPSPGLADGPSQQVFLWWALA